jgi:hypothetical protein
MSQAKRLAQQRNWILYRLRGTAASLRGMLSQKLNLTKEQQGKIAIICLEVDDLITSFKE